MFDLLPMQELTTLGTILKRKEIWINRNLIIKLTTCLSNYLEQRIIEPNDAPDRLDSEIKYLQYLQCLVDTVLFEGIDTRIDSVYDGRVFTLLTHNLERLRELLLEEDAIRLDRKQLTG